MKNKAAVGVIFILLQCVLYGIGDPISKVAYDTLSVFSLLTVRYWIGFAFLMIIFGIKVVKDLKKGGKNWVLLVLPSLCLAGTFLVSNIGIGMTSPTSISFLKSTATVMTPLMALIVFRRYYSPKHLPILGAVVIGLYLLCSPSGAFHLGVGETLGLISAVLGAGSLVFAEGVLDKYDAITITTVQTGTSALMATVCAIVSEGGVHVAAATPSIWMTIVYLALACTVAGYMLQNNSLKYISSSTAAVLQCMYPVMTAFFSFFILTERLPLSGIIGALIIIACVLAENLIHDDEPSQLNNRARHRRHRLSMPRLRPQV